MGWTVPFYSSFGSDFNYDFHVTLDEAVAPVEYNYRSKEELEQAGQLDLTPLGRQYHVGEALHHDKYGETPTPPADERQR